MRVSLECFWNLCIKCCLDNKISCKIFCLQTNLVFDARGTSFLQRFLAPTPAITSKLIVLIYIYILGCICLSRKVYKMPVLLRSTIVIINPASSGVIAMTRKRKKNVHFFHEMILFCSDQKPIQQATNFPSLFFPSFVFKVGGVGAWRKKFVYPFSLLFFLPINICMHTFVFFFNFSLFIWVSLLDLSLFLLFL